MIVRFKNRQQILKPLRKMSFWVTDLKETSIDVGVCCWWCCSRRRTRSGSFTYATVFLFCNASSSSTLLWKKKFGKLKRTKSQRLMPYDWPHFNTKSSLLFEVFCSAAIVLFVNLICLIRAVQTLRVFWFSAPNVRPSGSLKKITLALSNWKTLR